MSLSVGEIIRTKPYLGRLKPKYISKLEKNVNRPNILIKMPRSSVNEKGKLNDIC